MSLQETELCGIRNSAMRDCISDGRFNDAVLSRVFASIFGDGHYEIDFRVGTRRKVGAIQMKGAGEIPLPTAKRKSGWQSSDGFHFVSVQFDRDALPD